MSSQGPENGDYGPFTDSGDDTSVTVDSKESLVEVQRMMAP